MLSTCLCIPSSIAWDVADHDALPACLQVADRIVKYFSVRKQAKPHNGTKLQERLGSIYAACRRGILIRVCCPAI
jgi:hypothetical protein